MIHARKIISDSLFLKRLDSSKLELLSKRRDCIMQDKSILRRYYLHIRLCTHTHFFVQQEIIKYKCLVSFLYDQIRFKWFTLWFLLDFQIYVINSDWFQDAPLARYLIFWISYYVLIQFPLFNIIESVEYILKLSITFFFLFQLLTSI